MNNQMKTPIITIDGPTGSGKGTIGRLLARHLNWHFLDSGALYRGLALAVSRKQLNIRDEETIANLAKNLDLKFISADDNQQTQILFEDDDITEAIRDEACGTIASKISAYPEVRDALIACQRNFAKEPGLVADGRDMGTVIFPEAWLKIYLDADISVRAQRRFNQLQKKGIRSSLSAVLSELVQRDKRDKKRDISPLRPAKDAVVVDTTTMEIDAAIEKIVSIVGAKLG